MCFNIFHKKKKNIIPNINIENTVSEDSYIETIETHINNLDKINMPILDITKSSVYIRRNKLIG